MQLFLARLPKSLLLHSKGRVAIVSVVALALGLQWFVWFKRYPIVAVKQAETEEIQKLEQEVRTMEADWSDSEAERIEQGLRDAKGRLFDGDPSSSTWAAQMQSPPEIPGLALSVQPEKMIEHPDYEDTLVILPTAWSVKMTDSEADALGGVLAILHRLTADQPKWMDLTALTISGDEASLSDAQFELRLWFQKEPGL